MAERLTKEYYYTWDENGTKKLSYIQKLQNKLGKLEDILEKYGIESFELLEHIIKKGMVINSVIEDFAKEEYDKIKQDRDTWQKACELACDAMTKLGGDDCCGCRLNKEMCKICENKKGLIDYFYQQAKKEGENNDTNN